jgi:hypothetical protein
LDIIVCCCFRCSLCIDDADAGCDCLMVAMYEMGVLVACCVNSPLKSFPSQKFASKLFPTTFPRQSASGSVMAHLFSLDVSFY